MNEGFKLRGDYELILSLDNEVLAETQEKNLILDAGLSYILSLFCGASPSNMYVVPTVNPYTAQPSDTLATVLQSAGEVTSYQGASRPQFSGVATGKTADNSASMANFTFTGSGTVNGVIVCTQSAKGSSTGTLFSYVALSSPFSYSNGASLAIKYTVTAASA